MKSRYLGALFVCVLTTFLGSTAWSQVEVEPDQHYLLLAASRTSTMQEELDEAARLGFRIVAGSRTSGNEMVVLLERVATATDPYHYRLLATTKTSTMQEELDEAARQGFLLLPSTLISKPSTWGNDEIVVALEQSPTEAPLYEYRLLATSRTSALEAEVLKARDEGFDIHGMVSRGEHLVIMAREAAR